MFLVCFELLGDRAGFPVPHRHLRTSAGLEDVLDESCCGDAEDELAPDVAFDHWPTHTNNRVLRSRVCLMTGRQEFIEYLHRHEEIKVENVHLCFLVSLHRPGRHHRRWNPGGIDREFSLLWLFSERVLALPMQRTFVRIFEFCRHFSPSPMLLCSASFLLQGYVLCPFLKSERARIAFLKFTLFA